MTGKLSFRGKWVMGQILAVLPYSCLIKRSVPSDFSFIWHLSPQIYLLRIT